jgi:hypothetical protein
MNNYWNNKKILVGSSIALAVIFFLAGWFFGKGSDPICSALRSLPKAGRDQISQAIIYMKNNPMPTQSEVPDLFAGEIINKDDKSITIKLPDGGSKIVYYAPSTQIINTSIGSLSDLSVGKQVAIIGAKSPEGTTSAKAIQIKP